MTTIRLRIGKDGCVRGLFTDAVEWAALGHARIGRASHVEFCPRRQAWYVRLARPQSRWRRGLQRLCGWPCGEIVHWATTRTAALEWEHEFFGESVGSYMRCNIMEEVRAAA